MKTNPGTEIWKIIENIAHAVLSFFFGIFHKELQEEQFSAFMQFVKFGVVGVSNTLINYAIYVVSLLILDKSGVSDSTDYLIATVIAFIISVLWSFYWNNKYVFKEEEGKTRSIWKALVKTYVSYSFTGLFLNSLLMVFWVQVLHMSKLIAPILNLLISVPLNFIINKFWAFKSN